MIGEARGDGSKFFEGEVEAMPDPTAAERRLAEGTESGTRDAEGLLETQAGDTRAPDHSADSPALGIFRKIHPIGLVAAVVLVVAVVAHAVSDTERLVANMSWWQWAVLFVTVALSLVPSALHALRVGLEALADLSNKFVWILAWGVFIIQLINVVTRYLNPFFDQDILVGQLTSLAWQLFALIALLGLNYGVKAAVNPRIDFWWADWTDRTKAWLDFVMHTFFFLPFLWMSVNVVSTYAAGALGRRRGDGTWPEGWQVWKSWEQSSDADQLPVGPIKAMILVGFGLLLLQIVAEIIKTGFVLAGRREYASIAARDEFQRIE